MELQTLPTDKLLDKLSFAAVIFLWIYTAANYFQLPETIPSHFNLKGDIDDYGSKNLLLIIPLIVTLIELLLSFLVRRPGLMNKYSYPRITDPERLEKQVLLTRRLLRTMMIIIAVAFNMITFEIGSSVNNGKSPMSEYTIPAFIILMLLPTMVYIYKISRK